MKPLSVEDTQKLLELLWLIFMGPEQGVQTKNNWIEKKQEFKNFLKERGYEFQFPYGS